MNLLLSIFILFELLSIMTAGYITFLTDMTEIFVGFYDDELLIIALWITAVFLGWILFPIYLTAVIKYEKKNGDRK